MSKYQKIKIRWRMKNSEGRNGVLSRHEAGRPRTIFTNIMVLLVVLALGCYLTEWLLGFYLVKAVSRYPLPPHAVQRHATVDYDVVYRYNNYGLRGPDFIPGVIYDAVLLGDSFFFGQGVGEGDTLVDALLAKGLKTLNVSEIATNPIDYFHKLNVMKAQGLRSRAAVIGLCIGNDFQDIADKDIGEALVYRYRTPFLYYDFRSFLALERLRYQLTRKQRRLLDWYFSRAGLPIRETVVVHEFEHRRKFEADWLRFFAGNRPELMAAMTGNKERPLDREKLSAAAYLEKIQLTPESVDNTVRILKAMPSRLPDARFFVVLIPGPHYVWGFRSPEYERSVEQLKERLGASFTVIDLHGKTTPAMHFLHDGHWNARGHRLVADVLSSRLPISAP
ncbi:MAG TPA: SGNH/GDSL hydrolase family protein [Syntrophales bacterium]|nr:SGNH/GDSL hydrolase family protein [Syntrophales bacterium]